MNPRPPVAIARLEGGDLVGAAQGHADLVEAGHHRIAPPRLDGEGVALARGRGDDAMLEIDGDAAGALACLDLARQAVDRFRVEDDWQHAVLEAVVEEDVAIARRDDA